MDPMGYTFPSLLFFFTVKILPPGCLRIVQALTSPGTKTRQMNAKITLQFYYNESGQVTIYCIINQNIATIFKWNFPSWWLVGSFNRFETY